MAKTYPNKTAVPTHTVTHQSSKALSRMRRVADHAIRVSQVTHRGEPVWVQFQGLPSAHWDAQGEPLSSTVGPLDLDTLRPIRRDLEAYGRDGLPVYIGASLVNHRNEPGILTGVHRANEGNRDGKITVDGREYYARVWGLRVE